MHSDRTTEKQTRLAGKKNARETKRIEHPKSRLHKQKKNGSHNARYMLLRRRQAQQLVTTVKLVFPLSPKNHVLFLTRQARGEEEGDTPAPHEDASRDG